jgi:hypothetical protein
VHESVAWSKGDPFGAEYAEVAIETDTLSANGVAIGSKPLPYRLDYSLRTGPRFVTAEVEVWSHGSGWERSLKLVRSVRGQWSAEAAVIGEAPLPLPGGDTGQLDGVLDPDLGLSPLFNSMPVLRHALHDGGTAGEFFMVWISVPDLAIHARRSATRTSRRSLMEIALCASRLSARARISSLRSSSPQTGLLSTTPASRPGFARGGVTRKEASQWPSA